MYSLQMERLYPARLHTEANHVVLTNTCLTTPVSLSVSLICRTEFDLDYDSYHEDYCDRYCQKAICMAGHTPYCLLVCERGLKQDAEADSSFLPHSHQSTSLWLHFLIAFSTKWLRSFTHLQTESCSLHWLQPGEDVPLNF